MTLTGKQRRYLRSLGHNLKPIVVVGKDGLTQSLTTAVDRALEDHELIKIRLGQNAALERKEAAQTLAVETSSELAQILGNTILLYRRHPEEPTIKLPKPAQTSRTVKTAKTD